MIRRNLEAVAERIEKACRRAGRSAGEVRIMAVTKTVDIDTIREAKAAGIRLFGENRVQEARDKVAEGAFEGAMLCMIGHLQTNKASQAARVFDEVHSIDSVRSADALGRFAALYRKGAPIPVLIEVNAGRDPAKHGVMPEGALSLAEHVMTVPSLSLRGLLTVAPGHGDPDVARETFRTLRVLRDSLVASGIDPECLKELSMGMSADFDIAVEEGATIVRLGTVLFGPRA